MTRVHTTNSGMIHKRWYCCHMCVCSRVWGTFNVWVLYEFVCLSLALFLCLSLAFFLCLVLCVSPTVRFVVFVKLYAISSLDHTLFMHCCCRCCQVYMRTCMVKTKMWRFLYLFKRIVYTAHTLYCIQYTNLLSGQKRKFWCLVSFPATRTQTLTHFERVQPNGIRCIIK